MFLVQIFACGPDAAELQEQCGLAGISVLEEGTVVPIGRHSCTVLLTPGHTPGSVCFVIGDCIFTGDTLFVGSCGRVDLPGSDPLQMHASLRRLAGLPDELTVLPGHNYGPSPQGKIGTEKVTNMMIREAVLQASPEVFATSLARLTAPRLIAPDAGKRRGPTGSRVQAVTAACCAAYAEAVAGAEGGQFYCLDMGRPAMQPSTATSFGSL